MYSAGDVGVVEGEMNVPSRGGVPSGNSMEFNTLDEPIKETFVSCTNFFSGKELALQLQWVVWL